MSAAIKKILKSALSDSQWCTHTSMLAPIGKFQFNRDVLELFWNEYCKYVYSEEDPMVGINEVVQTFTPFRVDVDIKVPERDDSDLDEMIYSDKHILGVITACQNVIKNTVDNCKKEYLYCFVLEKNPYLVETSSGNFIKNGFHLHFPYLFLPRNDIELQMFPRIQQILDESHLFADLGFEKSKEVVDTKASCGNWLLYGSKKSEEMKAYILNRIYDHECCEITLEEALDKYVIYDESEKPIDIKENELFYLPRVLSIVPYGRQTAELKRTVESIVRKKISKKNGKSEQSYDDIQVSEKLKDLEKLLGMLSPSRAEDYHSWISIMFIIYNESEGNDEGLSLFIKFSSKCPDKFDEGVCVSTWEKTVKKSTGGLTMGTLDWFARQDNPEAYRQWREKRSEEHIKESLITGGGHNDLAKALFELYGQTYVCASVVYNTWYEFSGHMWNQVEEGITLREKISSDLVSKLNERLKEASNKLAQTEDESEKAMYNSRIKQIVKVMNSCKSAPFKNNIMKECKEVFYRKDFESRLNRDRFKICCANGVYDLKRFVFRPGVPDDYFSVALPVNYVEYTESDPKVQFVHRYFEKVFPDKSVRDYFYDISSDIFVGGNFHKKVYCWSGEGNNAKSVTQELFEKMLGKYANKLPTSLIVGKRTQSSAASPEIARVADSRWCVLQEPDKRDTMNIGVLKELSGNDTFFARGLYSAGKEIEPLFKLVLICNDPPMIPNGDKATWNRIRVIPFESTFCEDAPDTYEEQLLQKRFPVDLQFNEKIPDMLEPLLWMLLNHRKKGVPRIEPEKVKFATDALKQKNDVYRQFVEECLVEDKKASISLPELYNLFKTWYRDSLPNHPIPVKNELKEYFCKVWGEIASNKWKGYRPKSLQDDVQSGEAIILGEEDLINYSGVPM